MAQPDDLAAHAEELHRQIWEWGEEQLRPLQATLPGELAAAGLSLEAVLQELSDESLALAFQKRLLPRETFTALFVTRYGPYLARWLFRWRTDSHQALDLIQHLYAQFYERRLATYCATDNFRAYLRRSTYNLWVQKVCRSRKCAALDRDLPAAGPGPEQVLLDREAGERVEQALEQLRPRERSVLKETMSGRSADEIAQVLGLRKSQVFMALFQARRRMEQLLGLPGKKSVSSAPSPSSTTPLPTPEASHHRAGFSGCSDKEPNCVRTSP